jgi:hypothetical protein
MRCFLIALALTATACAKEELASPGLASGTFTGVGSDALCIAGEVGAQRAGFVVYGADNANCSASGRIEPAGGGWTLIPAGDAACKIPFSVNADEINLRPEAPNCAYYCGPGASFRGKSFRRSANAKPATDLAGDPLC